MIVEHHRQAGRVRVVVGEALYRLRDRAGHAPQLVKGALHDIADGGRRHRVALPRQLAANALEREVEGVLAVEQVRDERGREVRLRQAGAGHGGRGDLAAVDTAAARQRHDPLLDVPSHPINQFPSGRVLREELGSATAVAAFGTNGFQRCLRKRRSRARRPALFDPLLRQRLRRGERARIQLGRRGARRHHKGRRRRLAAPRRQSLDLCDERFDGELELQALLTRLGLRRGELGRQCTDLLEEQCVLRLRSEKEFDRNHGHSRARSRHPVKGGAQKRSAKFPCPRLTPVHVRSARGARAGEGRHLRE